MVDEEIIEPVGGDSSVRLALEMALSGQSRTCHLTCMMLYITSIITCLRDHSEVDPRDDREEFEASAGDTVVLGIDLRSVEDMPFDLDDVIHNFYHYMSEVSVDRIVGIETTQRQLEADHMITSGERASMAESIRSLRLENLKIRDDHDDLRRKLRRLESFAERRLGFRP
nr:hypothetical protein [Tanacetum cinerariifolium]